MSQVKSKRIAPSVVNTAVTVHVLGTKALDKEETERFLTKFIDGEETRSNAKLLDSSGATATTSGASVSQLKRIQRDLRGLPPLETGNATNTITSTSTIGKATPKKFKFDDEPLPEPKKEESEPEQQEEESIPEPEDVEIKDAEEEEEIKTEKISKEEKKRLKREAKEAKASKKASKKAKHDK